MASVNIAATVSYTWLILFAFFYHTRFKFLSLTNISNAVFKCGSACEKYWPQMKTGTTNKQLDTEAYWVVEFQQSILLQDRI